jgi:hypothetical protein
MPRITVTTNTNERPREGAVLLDELVHSVHLSTGHAAAQLIERLAWAIRDAEEAEGAIADRPQRSSPRPKRRRAHASRDSGRAIAA